MVPPVTQLQPASPPTTSALRRPLAAAALVLTLAVAHLSPAGAQSEPTPASVHTNWYGVVATFSDPSGSVVDHAAVVDTLFRDLTGAPPSAEETATWVAELERGVPRSEVAGAIATSTAGHRHTAAIAYQDMLDREIDAEGLEWAAGVVADGGPNRLRSALLGSQEYWEQSGSNATGYVTALYRDLLDREPDAGGLAHFVDAVDRYGRGRAVGGLLGGRETRLLLTDRRTATLLGREPTGTESSLAAVLTVVPRGEALLAAAIIDSPSWLARVPGDVRARVRWGSGEAQPAVVRRGSDGLEVLDRLRPSTPGTLTAQVELLVGDDVVDQTTATLQVHASETARWIDAARAELGLSAIDPSPAGMDRLATGGAVSRGREVRSWYLSSPAIHEVIGGMYERHLGRSASRSETQAWVDRMSRGLSLTQVQAEMLGSAEVWRNRAGGSAEGLAGVLTRDLLGREPQASDVQYVRQLLGQTTRIGAARAFIGTAEARATLVRRVVPEMLGEGLSGRELERWSRRIAPAPNELELRSRILASDTWLERTLGL